MTRAGRKATAALAVAVAITVGDRASANDEPIAATGQRETTIVVPSRQLRVPVESPRICWPGPERAFAKVYDRASASTPCGSRAIWTVRAVRRRGRRTASHRHTAVARHGRRRLISAHRIADQVLGQAHRASGRAYIFCDRIAADDTARKSQEDCAWL